MKTIAVLALMMSLAVAAQAGNYTRYSAKISTKNVVSGMVNARTKGKIMIDYDMDTMMFNGTVVLSKVMDMTMAHLHMGDPMSEGGVLAWVWPMDTDMPTMQPLSAKHLMFQFALKNATTDVTSLAATFAKLKEYMDTNMVYFNVHTVAYPAGVARGNLMMDMTASMEDGDMDI